MPRRLAELLPTDGLIVFLTGAGVSAESGIPTFRGPEGYWTVGSRVYQPEELATARAFRALPDEVWRWYLYRRGVCRAAAPNPAHLALAGLERALADRLLLVTQNVDGLHLRAGSSAARTLQIHGNLDFARCAAACHAETYPLASDVVLGRDAPLTAALRTRLACPRCGGPGRPHVLWFDEVYDEPNYRYASAQAAAERAALLVTVGTSGATTLPARMVASAARRGIAHVDVNPESNPFADAAVASPRGAALRGPAAELVPELCALLSAAATAGRRSP